VLLEKIRLKKQFTSLKVFFLTAASCPKKNFFTFSKGGKKAARKAAKKFIPKPVLLLS